MALPANGATIASPVFSRSPALTFSCRKPSTVARCDCHSGPGARILGLLGERPADLVPEVPPEREQRRVRGGIDGHEQQGEVAAVGEHGSRRERVGVGPLVLDQGDSQRAARQRGGADHRAEEEEHRLQLVAQEEETLEPLFRGSAWSAAARCTSAMAWTPISPTPAPSAVSAPIR
jgi:hypothetical protein